MTEANLSGNSDTVAKDEAYFSEVRKALGRGTPTVLLGTSNKVLDRSVAYLKKAEAGYQQQNQDSAANTLTTVSTSHIAEILKDQEEQRQEISRETAMGSRKHRRLPWWQRWIPKFVLAFDFALLLYFFAGITNVDWQSAVSMSLAFAITLAAMVTVLAYGFLAFTGHRMRSYKNHAGTVHLDELDGLTRAGFGIAMVVITVLAALMYLRIHSEVINALGSQAGVTALVIPLAVAVVTAVANSLVIAVHALDGSDEVARLRKLSAAAHHSTGQLHRIRTKVAQHVHR